MNRWYKKLFYNNLMKSMAVIILCMAGFMGLQSVVGTAYMPREKFEDNNYVRESLIAQAGYVRDWIVRYADETGMQEEGISEADIESYRTQYSAEALSREEVVNNIILGRKNYYRIIQDELYNKYKNIQFLARDLETGQVVTNIEGYTPGKEAQIVNELSTRELVIVGDGSRIRESRGGSLSYAYMHPRYYEGEAFLGEDNYEIYLTLQDPLVEGDWFYDAFNENSMRSSTRESVVKNGTIALIVGMLAFVYWIGAVGHRPKDDEIRLVAIDKIPFEVQSVGYMLLMGIWFFACVELGRYLLDRGWIPYYVSELKGYVGLLFVLTSVGIMLTLGMMGSVIRHFKAQKLTEYILTFRLIKWLIRQGRAHIQDIFIERHISVLTVCMIIGYMGINILLANAPWYNRPLNYLVMIAFNLVVVVIILKVMKDYKLILRGARRMSLGDFGEKIQLEHGLPVLEDMAEAVNTIGDGLETAVSQALKSERFKAELITNVSHDLKTPLTSIVSYIDLLKGEPIDNPTAKEYIGILEERSGRLKHLVEDLVDASKAVTGNLETRLETIDIKQFMIQAVGEYSDRLADYELEIIMLKMEALLVQGDSRHMWRIIENLLSNTAKYAMPRTRIYIEVKEVGDQASIQIKNISKEAITVEAEELTKRFVRGEESRSTEGSGLGLAISQSLARLQQGNLTVSVDGDLFKVEVLVPLVKESVVKSEEIRDIK